MALVHPDTAKLPPSEQKKGIYEFTPFEVRAYLRGEELDAEDQIVVRDFYQSIGASVPDFNPAQPAPDNVAGVRFERDGPALADVPTPRRVEASPAMAVPYGGKRVIKKPAPVFNSPLASLREIAELSVTSLPDAEAYALLVKLATRFNMEIE